MSIRPKVICMTDLSLAPEAREIIEEVADFDYQEPSREYLLDHIADCDALWSHFDLKIDKAILDRAERLRVVNTATTGTDHYDKDELARRGIKLLCIKDDRALLDTFTATAECAWMLVMACCRRFRAANAAAVAGDWEDAANRFRGTQLSGRTLGVLGVGRLGRMTVEYGKAFRMRVIACDERSFEIGGVERVDFDTLLAESDVVSLHIHMTPENERLFDAATLAKMRPGAVLVNTSRGDLVDESALLAALESGALAAFGADVLHDEWRADMAEQPVVAYAREHDNVVLTPHIAGATLKSIVDARVFSARKLAHYLTTGEELTMR